MNKNFKDLSGQKFGKLLVLRHTGQVNGRTRYDCLCDCGKMSNVDATCLKSGNTKTCGCGIVDACRKRSTTHGQQKIGNRTPEYRAWRHVKSRCLNPNVHNYNKYGGRGIKVCDRWINSFENFFADMGERPSKTHSIDRINVDGNYEPINCRWATIKEQAYNKTNTVRVEFEGDLLTVPDFVKAVGGNYDSFYSYVGRNTFQKAVDFYKSKAGKSKPVYQYKEKSVTLDELSEMLGQTKRNLLQLIKRKSVEHAIDFYTNKKENEQNSITR